MCWINKIFSKNNEQLFYKTVAQILFAAEYLMETHK